MKYTAILGAALGFAATAAAADTTLTYMMWSPDQLEIERRWFGVHGRFDEARLDPRPLNALFKLSHPSSG